jgi:hypothetical protein
VQLLPVDSYNPSWPGQADSSASASRACGGDSPEFAPGFGLHRAADPLPDAGALGHSSREGLDSEDLRLELVPTIETSLGPIRFRRRWW